MRRARGATEIAQEEREEERPCLNPASILWPLYVDPEPAVRRLVQETARTRRLRQTETIIILNRVQP